MSQAHKGSRLLIQDAVYAVPFESLHVNANEDAIGIAYGNISEPLSSSVYTMRNNEGKFGGAVAVEEGATNLWTTTTLAVYNNYNVPYTLVQTGETYNDMPVWRLGMTVDDAHSANLTHFRDTLTNHGVVGGSMPWVIDTQYAVSIYWRPVNKLDVIVGGTASNIAGWGSGGYEILADGWRRHYRYRYGTGIATATDSIHISFMCPSLQLNETVYIDFCCPQTEIGRIFPTSYIKQGQSRAVGSIKYDGSLFNRDAFTINMWVNLKSLNTSYNSIFECVSATGNRFLWMFELEGGSANKLLSFWSANASTGSIVGRTTIRPVVNQWTMYTITFSGTEYKQYINGVLNLTTSSTIKPSPSAGTPISIGGGSFLQANALFDDIVVLPNAVSDEEVQSWFIANKPFYNPYDYRGFAY